MRAGATALSALFVTAFVALGCASRAPHSAGPGAPSAIETGGRPARAERGTCGGPRCTGWSAIFLSGGRNRDENVVAHEHNVAFAKRTLTSLGLPATAQITLFGDGDDPEADLSFEEPEPARRRLLYGIGLLRSPGEESRDAILRYRSNTVPGALPATAASVLDTLAQDAAAANRAVARGDTPPDLFLYVTDHGLLKKDASNNVIVLWGKEDLDVRTLGRALDAQPASRRVVTVMAQCYSGSFAALVHRGGDPDKPLASASRCGFFAAPADRPAAGCSPKSDESTYDDYTTRFFSALGGADRGGAAARFDPDGDGRTTFTEAHLAALVQEHTQDVPVTSSEELLRRTHPGWTRAAEDDDRPVSVVLRGARPGLATAADALVRALDLPPRASIRDLHAAARVVREECWPGLCEADERLPRARLAAHRALLREATTTRIPQGPAALALVVLGRPRVEQWVRGADAEVDALLSLELTIERLRTDRETREARLLRLARLAELAILERRLEADGGPQLVDYRAVRACEDVGPWPRSADVTSSERPSAPHPPSGP